MAAQSLSLLNLENKLRQQPKIAHEQGAGSQCLRCGPKCSGFDLHYWRKVCRNCRCGKENHMVKDDEADPGEIRVGRLFDDGQPTTPSPVKLDRQSAQFDWIPPTSDSQLAAKYMEQLPTDIQPITGSQAAVDRKRALDRQLPVHDLDPNLCQSLTSNKEKKKLEDYVNSVKMFAVGRGLVQQCPARGSNLPPPPPQLDRILTERVNHLTLNQRNRDGSPAAARTPGSSIPAKKTVHFSTPKPFQPINLPPPVASASLTEQIDQQAATCASLTERIRQQAAKPSADEFDLPPPPPELLEPLETPEGDLPPPPPAVDPPKLTRDSLFDFLDFLDDDQKTKQVPGRIKSPFLAGSNFNSSPKPFTSPTADSLRSVKAPPVGGSPQFRPSGSVASNGQRRLLTTDLDNDPLPPPPPHPPAHIYNIQIQSDPARDHPGSVNNNRSPIPPAKEGPAGEKQVILEVEKVWLCQNCTQPVTAGQVAIFAERAGSDRCWHPQCFCCSICNEMLADLIYFFVDGNIFCGRHYAEKMNIPRCKACDELIFASEYTSAEDATWHTNHFCCWLCDQPLAGQQYTPVDGQPHCLDCYQKKYGKDCYECKQPIRPDEARVSHAEMHWHATATCFRCRTCHTPMLNRQFLLKKDHIYCSRNCASADNPPPSCV